tara:strand:+ start:314 stop:520 length:207 start_codon:yes stop_codon:yes gene_type:complete
MLSVRVTDRFPRKIEYRTTEDVIIPNPPRKMRIIRITWPVVLQYDSVSTTINPVTVTAEVAVKRASRI